MTTLSFPQYILVGFLKSLFAQDDLILSKDDLMNRDLGSSIFRFQLVANIELPLLRFPLKSSYLYHGTVNDSITASSGRFSIPQTCSTSLIKLLFRQPVPLDRRKCDTSLPSNLQISSGLNLL